MKTIPNAFVCCAVLAAAAAGFAGTALAQTKPRQADSHIMTVRLPDGSLERIRYTGDTPPKIDFGADPAAALFAEPVFDAMSEDSPFAELDRLSAMMDRQTAAMMQAADSVDQAAFADPRGALNVDFGKLPPGVQGYSVVSTMSGNTVCTRSIRNLGAPDGKAPRIQTASSGDCSAGTSGRPLQAVAPKPDLPRRAGLIEAGYHPPAKPAAVLPELVAETAY